LIVIRAPNHLGDLVMALPALEAAGDADVMLPQGLAPLLALSASRGKPIPFERGPGGYARAVRALRRGRYSRGVLLPPSLSSAALFAVGGVRERRGVDTHQRQIFLTDVVTSEQLTGFHRRGQYYFLVTGSPPPGALAPRLAVTDALRARFRALLPAAGAKRTIGIFPGSNAPSRRWSADRFRDLVTRLVAGGSRVVVFGGPTERDLSNEIAGSSGIDLGGRTDLPLLAAGLAECELVVSNDSGPLHLAAAVGTRTVSLWGAGDPAVTGPPAGHRVVRHPELHCVPCVKNVCPRHGRGEFLPDAHNECMHLIGVSEVEAAASEALNPSVSV
jgi:lipopolysaccharide heptosyltransferase II